MQESARAVLLTPSGFVLLMKVKGERRNLWITPGGRIRPGEDPVTALAREVREETAHTGVGIHGEIWVRNGKYFADGHWLEEREHFFLVPTEPFEPRTTEMEEAELRRHRGFRWWSIAEIAASTDFFIPRRIAELLRDLRQDGPPTRVLDVTD